MSSAALRTRTIAGPGRTGDNVSGVMTGIIEQVSRSNGGLPKGPIDGPVMLTEFGIEGDRQRDRRYHGGRDKAVLVVSAELICALTRRGFPVYAGAMGENLTTAGLDPHLWRAGQRYCIHGGAVIELTTLRTPCSHLDIFGPLIKHEMYDAQCKRGDTSSPHWAHGGFYARVVRGGIIEAGAPVTLESELP